MEYSLACSAPNGIPGTIFAAGDLCVIFNARVRSYNAITLTPGAIVGTAVAGCPIPHDGIIGRPHCTRILVPQPQQRRDRRGTPPLVFYALPYDPQSYALAAPMRTQILYQADIGRILGHLALAPGATVIEAGTGSTVLTRHLADAVGPTGRVATFEFNHERAVAAKADFAAHPDFAHVTVTERDVQTFGFYLPGNEDPEAVAAAGTAEPATPFADALFLDVPMPVLAIPHILRCVKPGGHVVIFSPCINQLSSFMDAVALHAADLSVDDTSTVLRTLINARADVAQCRSFHTCADVPAPPDTELVMSRRSMENLARRNTAQALAKAGAEAVAAAAAAEAAAEAQAGAARPADFCPYPLPSFDAPATTGNGEEEAEAEAVTNGLPAVRPWDAWTLPASSAARAQAERLYRSHTGFLMYLQVSA